MMSRTGSAYVRPNVVAPQSHLPTPLGLMHAHFDARPCSVIAPGTPPAPEPVRAPALPRQAMWAFVIAPPLLAFLFDPSCVKEPGSLARAIVAIVGYTAITGLAVHGGFEWLARRMRDAHWALRITSHAGLATLTVAASTALLIVPVRAIYPEIAGDELAVLWRGVLVSFVYLSVAAFVGHLQRVAVRERLKARAEQTAALEARLHALQAQMQPHFLFNSLNVCAGLVHQDPDAAEQTMDRLAGFLRYALESAEHRLVPLEDEIAAAASYLEIQHQRFGARIRYSVEVEPSARGLRIPPLLVQPLVENAIVHGLRSDDRGGQIQVRATVSQTSLRITVDDDGVGPQGSTRTGTGLGQRSVRERIGLLMGPRAELRCGASPLGGYRSTLVLPAVTR